MPIIFVCAPPVIHHSFDVNPAEGEVIEDIRQYEQRMGLRQGGSVQRLAHSSHVPFPEEGVPRNIALLDMWLRLGNSSLINLARIILQVPLFQTAHKFRLYVTYTYKKRSHVATKVSLVVMLGIIEMPLVFCGAQNRKEKDEVASIIVSVRPARPMLAS